MNMKVKAKTIPVLAILCAVASWGMAHAEHGHDAWKALMEPSHFFSLLGVVASTCLAKWSGTGPSLVGRKVSVRP